MHLTITQINAFSSHPEGGNPAGVHLSETPLSESAMQAAATLMGLSETAFVVPGDGACSLRWFSPAREIALCGHATLAAAAYLRECVDWGDGPFDFDTLSGRLRVEVAEPGYRLDLPAQPARPARPATRARAPANLLRGLGIVPLETYADEDYLLVLGTEAEVAELAPDFSLTRSHDLRGAMVTAPAADPDTDYVLRWFGSAAVGVDEDPVTGSAQCTLAPYWASRLGKKRLRCRQLSARGGELLCEHAGNRVFISGETKIAASMEIEV